MIIQGIADKVIQNVISRKITNKIMTKTVDDEVGYVVQITKTVWVLLNTLKYMDMIEMVNTFLKILKN